MSLKSFTAYKLSELYHLIPPMLQNVFYNLYRVSLLQHNKCKIPSLFFLRLFVRIIRVLIILIDVSWQIQLEKSNLPPPNTSQFFSTRSLHWVEHITLLWIDRNFFHVYKTFSFSFTQRFLSSLYEYLKTDAQIITKNHTTINKNIQHDLNSCTYINYRTSL